MEIYRSPVILNRMSFYCSTLALACLTIDNCSCGSYISAFIVGGQMAKETVERVTRCGSGTKTVFLGNEAFKI